ncbi:hypothetical protein MRX96_030750 [Rhipicephalus microplus]
MERTSAYLVRGGRAKVKSGRGGSLGFAAKLHRSTGFIEGLSLGRRARAVYQSNCETCEHPHDKRLLRCELFSHVVAHGARKRLWSCWILQYVTEVVPPSRQARTTLHSDGGREKRMN